MMSENANVDIVIRRRKRRRRQSSKQLQLLMAKRRPSSCFFYSLVYSITYISTFLYAQEDGFLLDYSCDALNDKCEFINDGVCNDASSSSPSPSPSNCQQGDCFDCDRCTQFDYDCESCLRYKCSWCPGTAKCVNSPYWIQEDSCTTADDYYTESCTSMMIPDNDDSNDNNKNVPFFRDPLYQAQAWVYDMIRVVPVWEEQGLTGNGVHVRINDNFVDWEHADLALQFDASNSCPEWSSSPSSNQEEQEHGTAVASILASAGNNNDCAVGISPGVTLSFCYALGEDDSSFLGYNLDQVDISQNSHGTDACRINLNRSRRRDRRRLQEEEASSCPFGYSEAAVNNNPPTDDYEFPCNVCNFDAAASSSTSRASLSTACQQAIEQHCTRFYEFDTLACLEYLDVYLIGGDGKCHYNVLSESQQEAISNSIVQGRDGKGIIWVVASGNAYAAGEDTNFEGFLNSRFTISVGAVGKDGLHSSYSTPGAALFLTAPGGDLESSTNHITAKPGGGCHNAGAGTSFACPVVSGVVALMLEANPTLGWRDVQGILARTSRILKDDPDDSTRVTNGGGLEHSNFYGFGVVNAEAAVYFALRWTNYGPEQMLVGETGLLNRPTPDRNDVLVVSQVRLEDDQFDIFTVETVVLYLDLLHFSRGDLEIILKSPMGTESILHPGNRPENNQLERDEDENGKDDEDAYQHWWKLSTVRHWEESAFGTWTLTIRDVSKGDVDPCIDYAFSQTVDNLLITCSTMARTSRCKEGTVNTINGNILNAQYEGRTVQQACCVCGGGTSSRNGFVDRLVQWRLVVYGRNEESITIPTSSPTVPPNEGIDSLQAGDRAHTVRATVALTLLVGWLAMSVL